MDGRGCNRMSRCRHLLRAMVLKLRMLAGSFGIFSWFATHPNLEKKLKYNIETNKIICDIKCNYGALLSNYVIIVQKHTIIEKQENCVFIQGAAFNVTHFESRITHLLYTAINTTQHGQVSQCLGFTKSLTSSIQRLGDVLHDNQGIAAISQVHLPCHDVECPA